MVTRVAGVQNSGIDDDRALHHHAMDETEVGVGIRRIESGNGKVRITDILNAGVKRSA
jgi:hypothetical protein